MDRLERAKQAYPEAYKRMAERTGTKLANEIFRHVVLPSEAVGESGQEACAMGLPVDTTKEEDIQHLRTLVACLDSEDPEEVWCQLDDILETAEHFRAKWAKIGEHHQTSRTPPKSK